MEENPPSTIRIIKNEPISPTEVRITMEMIVNVNRLAEVCGSLIHTAADQIASRHKD
jgi:hypothetical protein